jgi:hypothetical protein
MSRAGEPAEPELSERRPACPMCDGSLRVRQSPETRDIAFCSDCTAAFIIGGCDP